MVLTISCAHLLTHSLPLFCVSFLFRSLPRPDGCSPSGMEQWQLGTGSRLAATGALAPSDAGRSLVLADPVSHSQANVVSDLGTGSTHQASDL